MCVGIAQAAGNLALAVTVGAAVGFEHQSQQRLTCPRTNTLVAVGEELQAVAIEQGSGQSSIHIDGKNRITTAISRKSRVQMHFRIHSAVVPRGFEVINGNPHRD